MLTLFEDFIIVNCNLQRAFFKNRDQPYYFLFILIFLPLCVFKEAYTKSQVKLSIYTVSIIFNICKHTTCKLPSYVLYKSQFSTF